MRNSLSISNQPFPMTPSKIEAAINQFWLSEMAPDAKREFLSLIRLSQECRTDVVKFSEKMLGVGLNDFQRAFIERSTTPRREWMEKYGVESSDIGGLEFGRNIAVPSNQSGKTVALAIKHIHRCYYKIGLDLDEKLIDKAGYMTLNLSPHSRQAKQAFGYVKTILAGNFIIVEEDKKSQNKLCPLLKEFIVGENSTLGEIRFRNGSIFYTVPTGHDQGSSLQGAQFGYISYDEVAESDHLENELPARIMSRLIRYGTGIDLAGTPVAESRSQMYYRRIVGKGLKCQDGWWAITGTLDQNKYIPKEQRERAKAELMATDRNKYRQVVLGEFISSGTTFFDPAEIDHMYSMNGPESCIRGRKYAVVSDWGMADSGDPSVHYVFDYTEWVSKGKIRRVNHETVTGGSPHIQLAVLRSLYDAYTYQVEGQENVTKPLYVMDAGAMGGVLIKKLLADLSPKGFDVPKDEALMILRKAMSEGRRSRTVELDGSTVEENLNYGSIESYFIPEEAEQLGVYHIDDLKIKQDYVMTLMMGIATLYKKFPRAQIGTLSKGIDRLASYEQRGPGRQHKLRVEVTKLY